MFIFAASTPAAQPDYVALAMVLVLLATVAVMALRKRFGTTKNTQPNIIAAPTAEETPAPVAPGSAGQVKIYDVPPKTAAMIMAIVADKMGKPLNELRFISIREVQN